MLKLRRNLLLKIISSTLILVPVRRTYQMVRVVYLIELIIKSERFLEISTTIEETRTTYNTSLTTYYRFLNTLLRRYFFSIIPITWLFIICHRKVSQKLIPEIDELLTLQWLCKYVCYHVLGWYMFDSNLIILNKLLDKEVTDIEMSWSSCWFYTILDNALGWHIIL